MAPELPVRPSRSWPLAPSASVTPITFMHHVAFARCPQLLPLVRRQLLLTSSRKRAFAFSSSARACTTLSICATIADLVRLIGFHQRPHRHFCLFEVRLQVDQLHLMLLQDPVHRLPLIVGQVQSLHHVWDCSRTVHRPPRQKPAPWEADVAQIHGPIPGPPGPCAHASPPAIRTPAPPKPVFQSSYPHRFSLP